MPTDLAAVPLFIDAEPAPASVRDEVVTGLGRQPPSLPPKLFYDAKGSRLFDAICELDEYYPTRTETAIMEAWVDEMVRAIGPEATLVEYGSGSSIKTEILLSRLIRPEAYIPIDISRAHLLASAARIATRHPDLRILPVCADYTRLIPGLRDFTASHRSVVYFPGSTIGNFEPDEALAFLSRIASLVGPGGGLLIGVDLIKDAARLESAYDDAKGVTAAFNKNMLAHINRHLGPVFDLSAFKHRAIYNSRAARVEMHLVSCRNQIVEVDGHRFDFAAGDAIVTEHSHKFTLDGFRDLAAGAGFETHAVWRDAADLFSVHYLRAH